VVYGWYTVALTYKQIEAFARNPVERQIPDGTPNLYLHVRGSGALNWLCRVTVERKRLVLTVGKWPALSATKARALAPVLVRLAADGFGIQAIRNAVATTIDPDGVAALVRGERVAPDRSTPTFEEVAREWYENHLREGLSEGPYKRQVLQQLEDHVFASIGRRPINEIKRREITAAIRELWVSKYPTATKVRGNIERIFDYAIDNEFREDNPAPPPRSMPLKQHQVEHFRSLQHERVGELWQWLHTRPRMGPQTHVGIALAVLLGKRTNEIRMMTWDQIDFEQAVWITPSENMKKRKAHRQPLSPHAVEKLRWIQSLSFPGPYVLGNAKGKTISENAMLYALKRFDDITTHGFRATLGTWCAENAVDKRVMDFLKAHQPKYLDAAYQRTDMLEERRAVLDKWAIHVVAMAAKSCKSPMLLSALEPE
jgi:integrase